MERSSPVVVLSLLVVLASVVAVPGTLAATVGPAAADAAAASTGADPGGTAGYDATAGVHPPRPTDNTTARLVFAPARITRTGFETVRLGAGTALQSGRDGARHANDRIRIEREFGVAETVEEKNNVIDNALIDLEDETSALEAREQRTLRAYSDRNISRETLVRRLARIDARARNMQRTVQLLRTLSNRVGVSVFDSRLLDVEGRLTTLQGPVRHRVSQNLAGEAPPTRIHVTAADEGVVIATIVGGKYVREAKDWRNRNVDGARELETNIQALHHAETLYPWVVSQKGRTSVDWYGAELWRWRATHSQGELLGDIDASTRDVFREVQTLRVEDLPASTTIVNTSGGMQVTLERTYVGGPLRIYVEDASSGAAVNARVSVDGHGLGNAGADGYLRTIEPRTPYTVTVSDGDQVFTVTVERPFDESEG